jgi:hypothetical protein
MAKTKKRRVYWQVDVQCPSCKKYTSFRSPSMPKNATVGYCYYCSAPLVVRYDDGIYLIGQKMITV